MLRNKLYHGDSSLKFCLKDRGTDTNVIFCLAPFKLESAYMNFVLIMTYLIMFQSLLNIRFQSIV